MEVFKTVTNQKEPREEDGEEFSIDIPRGYWNKTIFRTGVAVLFLLLIFIFYQNGWSLDPKLSASCPENSGGCVNAFYYCTHPDEAPTKPLQGCPDINRFLPVKDDINAFNCPGELCDKKYMEEGETLGETPGYLERNYLGLVFFVLLSCFIINHLWYEYKEEGQGRGGV